jgi:NAD+ synthase
MTRPFSKDVLRIDAAKVTSEITTKLRTLVGGELRRRGMVVGLSGGIDSSVVVNLAVRALGSDRVFGLFMPERDTSSDALLLGRMVADKLKIEAIVEDIAPALEALGCYRRQDEAIRAVFPDYEPGWKFKVTLPSILDSDRLNVSQLTVLDTKGRSRTERMPAAPYLALIAATNFKQRVRKMLEYYHADRLNYAVGGTPNRLEHDQGFFVKQGDGAADVKPIAHLYKSQVFALGAHLGVPEEVLKRTPTTDTYSLPQTQEEFYFSLPYDKMDLCLYALDHSVPARDVAAALGLTSEQVERVYKDIESKRRVAHYLHSKPLLVQELEVR